MDLSDAEMRAAIREQEEIDLEDEQIVKLVRKGALKIEHERTMREPEQP